MYARCRTTLVAFALLLMAARGALAGPVEPKHLAADAKWYIHLDAEAFKQTIVFNQLVDAVRAQVPLEDVLDHLKNGIGINPLTDISGITIYNTSFEKDVAIVMIYAKVDRNLLIAAVTRNPEYKDVAHGKHTISTWVDPNDNKTKTGCFYGDGMILMADKVETLKGALDVLDGKLPASPALVKAGEKGAFLQASFDLARHTDQNLSQLLSNSDAAAATVSEAEGKLKVSAHVTAKTAEQGAQLLNMLNGLKSFGELATRDVPSAAAVLHKVQIVGDGAKILLSVDQDAKTLIDTLQKVDQENKARIAKAAAAPAPAK